MLNELAGILIATTAFFMLWYLWFYCHRPLQLRKYRQSLFDLRHKLFMYAAENNISFDDPAYLDTRYRINAMIRFAHKIGAAEMFLLGIFSTRCGVQEELEQSKAKTDKLMSALGEQQKAFFSSIIDELHWRSLSTMVTRSFVLSLVAFFIKVAIKMRDGMYAKAKTRILADYRPQLEAIDQAAMSNTIHTPKAA